MHCLESVLFQSQNFHFPSGDVQFEFLYLMTITRHYHWERECLQACFMLRCSLPLWSTISATKKTFKKKMRENVSVALSKVALIVFNRAFNSNNVTARLRSTINPNISFLALFCFLFKFKLLAWAKRLLDVKTLNFSSLLFPFPQRIFSILTRRKLDRNCVLPAFNVCLSSVLFTRFSLPLYFRFQSINFYKPIITQLTRIFRRPFFQWVLFSLYFLFHFFNPSLFLSISTSKSKILLHHFFLGFNNLLHVSRTMVFSFLFFLISKASLAPLKFQFISRVHLFSLLTMHHTNFMFENFHLFSLIFSLFNQFFIRKKIRGEKREKACFVRDVWEFILLNLRSRIDHGRRRMFSSLLFHSLYFILFLTWYCRITSFFCQIPVLKMLFLVWKCYWNTDDSSLNVDLVQTQCVIMFLWIA